ncbi:MAG: hypothetical protein G8237_13760 [Magnetococcales bacterium]|nr:hypothetical protein [Magnetococcales bacterium]NGZ07411.1 hypothetical protein [Magnetococcales bacterium]
MQTTTHPSPAQKKALQTIQDKRPVRIQQGILSALKSQGWIQPAPNDQPLGAATRYDLTALGQQALTGKRAATIMHPTACSIGLEAETCEECGGSGTLLILDEWARAEPCPWCLGSGCIQELITLI